MKHSIKNYLEAVTGCPVHMGKINYRRDGSLSRTITIMGNFDPDESLPDEIAILEEALTVGIDGRYKDHITYDCPDEGGNMTIKIVLNEQDWKEYEYGVVHDIDWEEWDEFEEEEVYEEERPTLDTKAILDGLHIGVNITPLGVGYAKDEEDLEKLKLFLAGALSMGKVVGMY